MIRLLLLCLNEQNMKITKRSHYFEGYASSYNVEILILFNPELKDTISLIKNKLIDLLPELKGFKFMATLATWHHVMFSSGKTLYSTFYSNSKAKINTNDVFKSISSTVMSNIQKFLPRTRFRLEN